MTLPLKVGIVAAGGAFLIPGIPAAWKAASMRGDLFEKWNGRVDLAINGLSEKAARELLRIQGMIRDSVVEGAVTFEPLRVVREPSELRDPMKMFLRILRVRDRTLRRFKRLLIIGPGLLVSVTTYMVGIVLAIVAIAQLVQHPALGRLGLGLACLGATGMVVGFAAYAYLQHRLSGAEILSQPDETNG